MDKQSDYPTGQLTLIGFGSSAIELIDQMRQGPESCDALKTIAMTDDLDHLNRSTADLTYCPQAIIPSELSSILVKSQVNVFFISNRDPKLAMASIDLARLSKEVESVTIAVYLEDDEINSSLPDELLSEYPARVCFLVQSNSSQDLFNQKSDLYRDIEGGLLKVLKAIIANQSSFFTLTTFYELVHRSPCQQLLCGSIKNLRHRDQFMEHPQIRQAREQWSSLPVTVLWIEVNADDHHESGSLNKIHEVVESLTQGYGPEFKVIFGVQHAAREVPEEFDLSYLAMISAE